MTNQSVVYAVRVPITLRKRDAGRTTADLLRAAEHEFAEHGFAGARVDRIARRAGCNKALIFQRFGDKQGLYTAVFAAFSQRWTPTEKQLREMLRVDTREAFASSIRMMVEWSLRFLRGEPRAARILMWEVASDWALLGDPRSHGESYPRMQLAPIREFLDAADRSGFLRSDLPSEAQLSLVTQVPMLMGAMRFDLDDPALATFLTDFIVTGLVGPVSPDDHSVPTAPTPTATDHLLA